MAEKAKSPAGYSRAFDSAPSLAALSEAAIHLWRDRASGAKSPKLLDEALMCLLEISRRLDIQADNSREVFDQPEPSLSAASALQDLGASCSKARI